MGLNIYFSEDVAARLTALAQANERAYALALGFGADPEAARLCRDIYQGALDDVGAAFGLAMGTALTVPYEREVIVGGHELSRQ